MGSLKASELSSSGWRSFSTYVLKISVRLKENMH